MYKYLSIVIIFFCICYIGYLIKSKYKTKYNFFNELVKFTNNLLIEISNNKTSINKVIDEYVNNNKNDFSLFLTTVKDNLKNNLINKNICFNKNLFLTNSEIQSITDFINKVGLLDYENSIKCVKKYLNTFENYLNISKENLTKKGDLYFKLIIVLALTIVIILL